MKFSYTEGDRALNNSIIDSPSCMYTGSFLSEQKKYFIIRKYLLLVFQKCCTEALSALFLNFLANIVKHYVQVHQLFLTEFQSEVAMNICMKVSRARLEFWSKKQITCQKFLIQSSKNKRLLSICHSTTTIQQPSFVAF